MVSCLESGFLKITQALSDSKLGQSRPPSQYSQSSKDSIACNQTAETQRSSTQRYSNSSQNKTNHHIPNSRDITCASIDVVSENASSFDDGDDSHLSETNEEPEEETVRKNHLKFAYVQGQQNEPLNKNCYATPSQIKDIKGMLDSHYDLYRSLIDDFEYGGRYLMAQIDTFEENLAREERFLQLERQNFPLLHDFFPDNDFFPDIFFF